MPSAYVSSPASDIPGSPTQLSPRSRIKALLAAVDENSDVELSAASRRLDFVSTSDVRASISPEAEAISSVEVADELQLEEYDDLPVKPRGRLATRMNAANNKSYSEDDHAINNERVENDVSVLSSRVPAISTEEQPNVSTESEDTSVITRKPKVRRARDSTPYLSSRSQSQSSRRGMFVSPNREKLASTSPNVSGSDADLPSNPMANARFMELIAKKREERLAKENIINQEKAKKAGERKILEKNLSDMIKYDAIYDSDEETGGRRLTQQVRPTRRAGKKAQEEINRETQRMSRNMQLAHEARTKKKITKSSLFAKFNYKPAGFVQEEVEATAPTSSSSPYKTDADLQETPPTSPTYQPDDLPQPTAIEKSGSNGMRNIHEDSNDDVPTLSEALTQPVPSLSVGTKINKGKGTAIEICEPVIMASKRPAPSEKPFRVRQPNMLRKPTLEANESDSDLEIVTSTTPGPKSKTEALFDRVPALQVRESHSLHALRMLAHLTSPGKKMRGKTIKPFMTATELTVSLQQRARQQANREREERLQVLRDRGVTVQSTEERDKEMAEVEDLISKARREGEEIMKKEREALKKELKVKSEVVLSGDSTDDEEWAEQNEKSADQSFVSGSGSDSDEDADGEESDEDEEDNEGEDDAISVENDNSTFTGTLVDDEASESETEETENEKLGVGDDTFINDNDNDDIPAVVTRRGTKQIVLSDDDNDDDDNAEGTPAKPSAMSWTNSPSINNSDSPIAPPSVLRSATKTFIPGLTVAGPAGLGLTQIFAGTMDDTQTQIFSGSPGLANRQPQEPANVQDSLAYLRNLPAPVLPGFEPTMEDDSQDIVRDSQIQGSQIPESMVLEDSQPIQLQFTQSQIRGFDSMVQDPFATQLSEFPEPTQDVGFREMSPIKGRFAEAPPSTVDTLVLSETPVPDSPLLEKKRGKLRRRAQIAILSDDEEISEPIAVDDDELDISVNVFDILRKASNRKPAVDEFDKKKSGAKEMVHEQAEESEDEYAGLGGASDDESGGEVDAFVKEMIDDEVGKDADESKLAAFYADKERANDSKAIEKLFRDITNGTLRRKRGADYSLSDSDDDGEARRRMKRRDFAKMRKALLEDERIGKIAENPKKLAFLRAIEDYDDDEMNFLDDVYDFQDASDSQSHIQSKPEEEISQVNDSQPGSATSSLVLKRKLSTDRDGSKRLPPHMRRTQLAQRPSNLSEVRQTLSSLIDAPNAILAGESSDSGSDLEVGGDPKRLEGKENNPFARRGTSIAVVDRISLKRASTSDLSTYARLAFTAPSATPGFKVPALLRRATTNSSMSSMSSSSLSSGVSGTERYAGGVGEEKVMKKAGKNSGVQYMAREKERKLKLIEGEKKREEKRWKGAVGRQKVVGGLFGAGKFE